jgi:hypothetical protein
MNRHSSFTFALTMVLFLASALHAEENDVNTSVAASVQKLRKMGVEVAMAKGGTVKSVKFSGDQFSDASIKLSSSNLTLSRTR